MAKIFIRGYNTPQTVSVSTAKKVDDIKKDDSIPDNFYISLDNFSCDKRDIKSVIIYDTDDDSSTSRADKQEENNKTLDSYNKEFNDEIRRYATGSLEGKLQFNLKVATMYCFALTGGAVDSYKTQLKPIFLEELKRERLIVNPTKYIKLFIVDELVGESGLTKIDYILRASPLRLMQNYLPEVYATLSFLKL